MSRFTSQKGRIQYVAPTARAFFPNSSFFLFSCQTQVMINLRPRKKGGKKKDRYFGTNVEAIWSIKAYNHTL